MAYSKFKNSRIVGISAAVPKQNLSNKDLSFVFENVTKTAAIAGVENRRRSPDLLCTSDLCFFAAEKILSELCWDPKTIDGIIFISQTPDYRLPATACVLHKRLELSSNALTLDINLGCSGYVNGLYLANSLIESGQLKRILLLTGDTNSKFISKQDLASQVLFGDAGTATCIEYCEAQNESHFILGTDGTQYDALTVYTGGFRKPPNEVDAKHSFNELYMNGSQVYSFALKEVPKLYHELLDISYVKDEQINYFFFHQANSYMLDNLIQKLNLAKEKCPMNIRNFGNTNSASLPLLVVTENKFFSFEEKDNYVFMAGFGVGLSWGGALLSLNQIKIPNLIEVE